MPKLLVLIFAISKPATTLRRVAGSVCPLRVKILSPASSILMMRDAASGLRLCIQVARSVHDAETAGACRNFFKIEETDMALVTVQVPFRDGLDFGIGVDSNTTSPMNTVVEGEITGVTDAHAAKAGFHIARIETTHDLETALKIDVSAGYGSVAFGAGIADRFSFAASSKIHSSSLFMAITANVQLETHSIDRPALTADAAEMRDNPANFNVRFGDMFVRGIGRGGLFVAVLSIETKDEKTTQDISNKLSGAYGAFSADAETKFSEVQRDFSCSIDIRVYHEGGPVDLIMDDIENPTQLFGLLKRWFKSFADSPDMAAVPYFAVLAPTVIASGPLPLNAAETEHAQDVLVFCARQRSSILDSLNLMDAIIQTPTKYVFTPPVTIVAVKAASTGFQADLDTIAATASEAMNHPAKAKLPADFAKDNARQFPQGVLPEPIPSQNAGDLSVLAARGEFLSRSDPLLASLREVETAGVCRTGFDVGLAVAENHTFQGPGKEKFKNDHLKDFDPGAYQRAVDYTVDRNRNAALAGKGATVVAANAAAAAERSKLPPTNQWLGFNICSGIFGSLADGGSGHTSQGPGSRKIRDDLSSPRPGYDVAMAFYGFP
jgi:hypothetical protein